MTLLMNRLALTLAASLALSPFALHAQSAVDERAIIETASELDMALDTKNWERARALLLEEVSVERPGSEPARMAADELVQSWRDELHAEKVSFHLRGSEVVVFDGADSAVLQSKARVQLSVAGVAGDDGYSVSRDYTHELDRGEDGWRVRRLAYDTRMEDGNPAVLHHRLPPPETDEPAGEQPADAAAAPDEEPGDTPDEGAPEAAVAEDESPATEAAGGDEAPAGD